ncbi:MAG TPA: recombinase family protein [Phytomonospora sp.]
MNTPDTFRSSPPEPGGEPWIGYIRVSTWKEEKISDTLQRTAIEQWAARTGRRISDWVIDLDATGRNFKRKIMQAITRVENGEARGIAVWRYSRFGRNRTGNAVNLARLEAVGGQLESATEASDARTAVGELQREMIFAFGNFESNRAGEQWREAHDHRRALKLPATGRGRFGYIWHPRRVPDPEAPGGVRLQTERYELHPDHAPVVEELYERKTAGDGFGALAHWMNDELGIPTSRGNRWAINTVQRYLDSGFAAGLLHTHDPECPCKLGQEHFSGCRNGRMLYLPGAQPPIITLGQWEAYQKHRAATKVTAPRARVATYTTTGLARCGHCRGGAVARSSRYARGDTLVCYNHKTKGRSACEQGLYVDRVKVEAALLEWLRREAAPDIDALPPTARAGSGEALDPAARVAQQRARTQAEIGKVDAALDRLVTDHVMNPGKYPEGSFERVRDQLAGRKAVLVGDLAKLSAVEATPQREEFTALAVGVVEEWETLDGRARNSILKELVRRIVCTARKVGHGKTGRLDVSFEVHPVWEPDPWEVVNS